MRALLTLVVAAACASGPARPAGAAAPPFDEWFPKDTALYLSVRDLPGLRARLARTALWQDPAFQDLLPAPVPAAGRLWEYVAGECAVGVLPAAEGAADVLLLLDVGDQGPRVRELLLHAQGGRRYAKTRYRGVQLMVEVAPRDPRRRACWYLEDRRLAYASDYDLMRRRIDKEGEPLARHADYRRVRAGFGGGAALFAYYAFNLASPEVRRLAGARLDALGLASVRAIGAVLDLRDDRLVARAHLLAPGPKRGVLKLAASGNRKLEPPAFLPATTSSCLTFQVHWSTVWREFVRAGDALGQQTSRAEERMREATRAVGLDFDKDILGSLGDEVTVLDLERRVLLVEVRHGERLAKVLKAVTAETLVQEVTYKGVPVRALADGTIVALLDGTLLIAQSANDVRTLIDRAGPGVRETAAYAEACAGLPERRILFWFYNPAVARRAPGSLEALARRHVTAAGGAARNVGDGVEATFFVGLRPAEPVTRVVSAR